MGDGARRCHRSCFQKFGWGAHGPSPVCWVTAGKEQAPALEGCPHLPVSRALFLNKQMGRGRP